MKQQIPKGDGRAPLKFKRLRLLRDDARSWLQGYRFGLTKHSQGESPESWVLLAEFATGIHNREELGAMNQNRVANMALSCSLVDGLVLQPGEVFSFRKIVGDPTPERGFLMGPMIQDGDLAFTSGGGLCQVTTTLFNAALLADLEILEKHHHSRDIWGENRFIGLGRDAICVYGRKDLKFRNSISEPILFRIQVEQNPQRVCCRIFSKSPLRFTVEVTTRIIKKIPPRKRRGKPGKAGWRPIDGFLVETTRTIHEGQKVRRSYRKRETYQPGWRKNG
jgi:vancomycin resistance protein VanW